MPSEQQNLFDTEPEAWDLDDAAERRLANVVLPAGPEGEFSYLVPEELLGDVEPGRRVQAPLGRGNRNVVGYCTEVATRPVDGRALKAIRAVLDKKPLLSPPMLRLTRWISEYYLCRWGQVIEAVLPAGVRSQAGTRSATLLTVSPSAGEIHRLDLPEKQQLALTTLAKSRKPLTNGQLAKMAGCTTAPINALRKKGLIQAHQDRVRTFTPEEVQTVKEEQLTLNEDQQVALHALLASLRGSTHETVLVHGVTGSGKTEVYMQAISEVIGYGRQAIVLVPEISLTPQTRERFRRRFDQVAVLHSHMTDSERAWHWEQIAAGAVSVVVGARSAIFAPTPNLGLIILDEEHESSFKQGEAPRYHARDVAIRRAEAEEIPLVLGSATPSLESWQRAQDGSYRLVSLPRRVMNLPLPDVATVDLRLDQERRGPRGAISRQLLAAMKVALDDDGQIILLLNRRGFATHIQCPSCGTVIGCPACEIALTHHRHQEIALCHYCDFQIPAPNVCPECKFSGIRYSGLGTQKLEAEIRARFPDVPALRMDTDSMSRPGAHEQALDQFRRGDVRILLGTQMIAKGLDFPNVTLVGVINADTALHLPDFRAAERTFHLVTQVAGRTGRGEKGGRVLVQTLEPGHAAIQAAARHDYHRFAASELPIRREHGYPPFAAMIRLVVRGPKQNETRGFAEHLAACIREQCEQLETAARVMGPAPAPIPKLRGNYRFQIQAQSKLDARLRDAVRDATAGLKPPEEVQWIADVDPLDML